MFVHDAMPIEGGASCGYGPTVVGARTLEERDAVIGEGDGNGRVGLIWALRGQRNLKAELQARDLCRRDLRPRGRKRKVWGVPEVQIARNVSLAASRTAPLCV